MSNLQKAIIIIFVIILVIGLGVGGYYIYEYSISSKNNPSDLLLEYFSNLSDKNYEKMYSYLTEESKQTISKEDFITRNKNIYDGIEANNITVEITQVNKINNDKTQITYTTYMNTLAGKINFSNTVDFLKNKDKKYYLNWSSKVIYPELEATDKVRVATVEPKRGQILDRNNVVLAGKGVASSVGLVPGKMSDNREEDISNISKILNISVEKINQELSASYVKEDTFVPLKTISNLDKQIEDVLLQTKGVMIKEIDKRQYPLGEKLSHLIGYIQNINAEELEKNKDKGYTASSVIGKTGLEKYYEDRLKGTIGYEIYIINSNGNKKHTIVKKEGKDGDNIKLTIDANLQAKIYEDYKNEKSATVVINPKTGEILALVSTPSYDSNDFINGISEQKWNELSNNADKPFYSRYQATWAPGSSFKPVIAAIGLTTNKFTAEENFGKSGTSWQKDSSWGNFKVTTLATYGGIANLRNALVYSDNIYFAKAALKIGTSTLIEQFKKIGFDAEVTEDLSVTKSQYGNNGKITSEAQLANTGYGQGEVLVNPLHMASIYSAFVNNGNMIKPYLEYKEAKSPEYLVTGAFSEESANTVKEDLIQVVENPSGTGHSAKISGVTLAGKTGTAEIKKSTTDTTGTELGWFNAFIADENSQKQMLVISMIEDVKNRGGSHYVVPKVKKIFEY